MRKIAVITQGVKLHDEKGYTRFAYIANFLVENGFQVDLITSSFQHWEKAQRNLGEFNQDLKYNVIFIEEPGYKKNIDYRRIKSHRVFADNLKKYLVNKSYDLVYFEIPPNNMARVAVDYAEQMGIPCIADVNDLWPEAMKMILDIPLISDILFYPLKKDAENVYKRVSGVIGTSQEYADRPHKYNCRSIPQKVVYVGNDLDEFDAGVKEYTETIIKDETEFWVTYAGTLGKSYDISTLIYASSEILKRGYKNIKIKILGNGPTQEEVKKITDSLSCDVEFLGYMSYKKMAAYLSKSDLTVNSVVKKSAASIITKIGDYLAAAKPMINTCSSHEFQNKVEHDRFGINVEAENVRALTDAIIYLYENKELCREFRKNARQVAERDFDRKNSYKEIVNLINDLIGEDKNAN